MWHILFTLLHTFGPQLLTSGGSWFRSRSLNIETSEQALRDAIERATMLDELNAALTRQLRSKELRYTLLDAILLLLANQ